MFMSKLFLRCGVQRAHAPAAQLHRFPLALRSTPCPAFLAPSVPARVVGCSNERMQRRWNSSKRDDDLMDGFDYYTTPKRTEEERGMEATRWRRDFNEKMAADPKLDPKGFWDVVESSSPEALEKAADEKAVELEESLKELVGELEVDASPLGAHEALEWDLALREAVPREQLAKIREAAGFTAKDVEEMMRDLDAVDAVPHEAVGGGGGGQLEADDPAEVQEVSEALDSFARLDMEEAALEDDPHGLPADDDADDWLLGQSGQGGDSSEEPTESSSAYSGPMPVGLSDEELARMSYAEIADAVRKEVEHAAPMEYDYRYKEPSLEAMFPSTRHIRPGAEDELGQERSGVRHLPDISRPGSYQKILKVGRHCKVVKGGRVFSFSVLFLTGNGKGAVGIGYGKALEIPDALRKAKQDANKNMVIIDLVDNRTISHMVKVKFRRSFVMLKPGPQGFGLRTNNLIRKVARAAGIQDLSAKTHGSRVTHTMIRAILKGLQRSCHPEVKARQLGQKVYDHARIWRKHGVTKQY